MKPNISEFSYGFALTSELIQSPGMTLTAAPVFPSLYQEGQAGGGWDVQLSRPGILLFLQFKLTDFMTRGNCREARDGRLGIPCYRMNLRSSRTSRQHEMLLDLEAAGEEVYYSAPAFHQPDELNAAFLAGLIRSRSVWLRPSEIGPLRDDRDHHVSFQHPGPCSLFSEPRPLRADRDFHKVFRHIEQQLRTRGKVSLLQSRMEALAEKLAAVSEKRTDIGQPEKETTAGALFRVPPLQRIAYYASVFLDCRLFVVQEKLV